MGATTNSSGKTWLIRKTSAEKEVEDYVWCELMDFYQSLVRAFFIEWKPRRGGRFLCAAGEWDAMRVCFFWLIKRELLPEGWRRRLMTFHIHKKYDDADLNPLWLMLPAKSALNMARLFDWRDAMDDLESRSNASRARLEGESWREKSALTSIKQPCVVSKKDRGEIEISRW